MTDIATAHTPAPEAGGEFQGSSVPRVLIGTDLVAVKRVETLLAGRAELAQQVFTARELAYCASRKRRCLDHLAARFAAKEAVMKALGTGAGVAWSDIEVVNSIDGRPEIRLHGRAAALARHRGVGQIEISLTHTEGLAMAYAVLICSGEAPGPARDDDQPPQD